MDFDVIICFETHVELGTKTKLFCDCEVKYDAAPNSCICPVCTGQPGALPVLNKKAVEYCVRAGLVLNCTINKHSRFARKNYFYPDLPKGYQISQYELPFCEDGYLVIQDEENNPYPVGIKRIHLEEDAGKLVHSSNSFDESTHSFVDYNRSSVPLIEIVGDHEKNPLRSVKQVRIYLEKIRQVLRYCEISECIIEKGQFRCDVNVSIRPKGSNNFGNRTEIKNMSSFKFITTALEYEIKRQSEILNSGGTVVQETRLFDEQKKITLPMRSKEDAPDYRYFPDPDLIQVDLDEEFIKKIKQTLPELPDQKVERFVEEFAISKNDATILTKDKNISDYFESSMQFSKSSKKLTRWIIKELFTLLNETSISINDCLITPKDFAHLVNLVSKGTITESIGKTVLETMFKIGEAPEVIIEKDNLMPIQDTDVLGKIIDKVISDNPKETGLIKDGEIKIIDFFIGQVMKATKGKANPQKVRELIREKLIV